MSTIALRSVSFETMYRNDVSFISGLMTNWTNFLQFKGLNKTLENPPLPLGRRGPAELPDHPVWKISEPAVALGLLEVRPQTSTTFLWDKQVT